MRKYTNALLFGKNLKIKILLFQASLQNFFLKQEIKSIKTLIKEQNITTLTRGVFHSFSQASNFSQFNCNLVLESPEYLFYECCKSQGVWNMISATTSKRFQFPTRFVYGNWISLSSYSMRTKVIIALATWFLWKALCDAIFRNIRLNFSVIALQAINYANVNLCALRNPICRNLIISNFTSFDGLFLFSASSWSEMNQVGRGVFCFIL